MKHWHLNFEKLTLVASLCTMGLMSHRCQFLTTRWRKVSATCDVRERGHKLDADWSADKLEASDWSGRGGKTSKFISFMFP